MKLPHRRQLLHLVPQIVQQLMRLKDIRRRKFTRRSLYRKAIRQQIQRQHCTGQEKVPTTHP